MERILKVRNIVAGLFCSMLLLESIITVNAATPYAVTIPCPQCDSGVVTRYISRAYEHDETFPCEHHGKGFDLYAAYEVTERKNCDSCSYSTSRVYTEHVFLSCHGND